MDQEEWKSYEEASSKSGSDITYHGTERAEKERGDEIAEAILNESYFRLSQLKSDLEQGETMSTALGSNYIDYTEGLGDKGYGFMGNVIPVDESFFRRYNLGAKFDEEFWISNGIEQYGFSKSDIKIHLVGQNNPSRAREFINKDTERLTQELSNTIMEYHKDEEAIVERYLERGGQFSYYRDNWLFFVVYLPFSIACDHPLAQHLREYRERNVRRFYTVEGIYGELVTGGRLRRSVKPNWEQRELYDHRIYSKT